MRSRIVFLLVACLAILAAPWFLTPVQSQQPLGGIPSLPGASTSASASSAGDIICNVQLLPNGRTQVIVMDATTRSLASYHVDSDSGVISLKSVRSIFADLKLEEFNGMAPPVAEVRGVVGK